MAATKGDIRRWFNDGVALGASHLIIVCDSFDWEDYPIYVMPYQQARHIASKYNIGRQTVMEVYDLKIDREAQIDLPLVMNY